MFVGARGPSVVDDADVGAKPERRAEAGVLGACSCVPSHGCSDVEQVIVG